MAMGDKNLYNAPSSEALRELFHRRLGIDLRPDLVTYSLTPSVPTPVTDEVFATGDGSPHNYPLTYAGVAVTGAVVSAILRTDWDGAWVLSATPHTNVAIDSEDLSTGFWTRLNGVTVNPSALKYGGVIPYWEIATTITRRYTGVQQVNAATIAPGGFWTMTAALRASANNAVASLLVNQGPDISVYSSTAKVLVGPGTISVTNVSGAIPGGNGPMMIVSDLSQTEDTLVQFTVQNIGTQPAALSIAVLAGSTNFNSGISVLATRVSMEVGVDPKAYLRSSGAAVTAADYTLSGSTVLPNFTLNLGSTLQWSGTRPLSPTVTVTANAQAADGTVSPYIGSVTYPIQRLSVAPQLPEVLVWSDNYPMSVDALAAYLQQAYGYYLEDGEFFGIGDATQTPLVRGGTVNATIDPTTHRFRLQATDTAMRWMPGSTLTFQQALSGSIAGEDGMIFLNSPPDGVMGQPYDFTYQTDGGRAPVTYVVEHGTAPAPLDPQTGRMQIASLPSAMPYQWIVLATDADGVAARQEASIEVSAPPLVFNPPTDNPAVTTGEPTDIDLGVTGGALPLTYVVYSGALPTSAAIVDGHIVGVFDGNLSAGQTTLTSVMGIKVTDAQGASISRLLTLTITDRSTAQIQAALRAKVLNWYAAPAASLTDTATWPDATGRMDLTVHGSLPLTVGPNGANALDLSGGYAQANTTAYNLAQDFALVLWAKNVNPTQGQVPLSRGGDASGQYEVSIDGTDGLGWALTVTMDDPALGLTIGEQAKWPVMVGAGAWAQSVLLFRQNNAELVTNAGTPIAFDGTIGGTLVDNFTDPLTVGISAKLLAGTQYTGQLSSVSIFTDKLWSDERKWLYNAGTVRAYAELGWLAITGTFAPATVDSAYTSDVAITGGDGNYSNVQVIAGALPPWGMLSIVGNNLHLSGVPTSAATYNFTVSVDSGDGQTATLAMEVQVTNASMVFVKDTFTGAANTLLVNHVGEVGGWSDPSMTEPGNGYINFFPEAAFLNGSGQVYGKTGTYNGSTTVNQTTCISNVVAPQMDFYVQMVVNVGTMNTGGSSVDLVFYEQQAVGNDFGKARGFQFYFYSTGIDLYHPDWMTDSNGAPYSVSLAPVADNTTVTLRVEYKFSTGEYKVYFNGTLVWTLAGPDYTIPNGFWPNAAGMVPGIFAFDLDGWSAASPPGPIIDYLELGTL